MGSIAINSKSSVPKLSSQVSAIICPRSFRNGLNVFNRLTFYNRLNKTICNIFQILGNLYSDMVEAFYPATAILRSEASREKNNFQKNRNPLGPRLPMFHMGGDEVNFDCWAKDENIVNWLNKNGYSTKPSVSQEGFVRLWAEFQGKALDTLKEVNGALKSFKDGVLIWTSELTKPFNIEKYDAIIDKISSIFYRIEIFKSSAKVIDF